MIDNITLLLKKLNISEDKIRKILEIFFETEDHVNAEKIKSILLKRFNLNIKIEDIENVLISLTEYGFAQKVKFDNQNVMYYEHLHFKQHHDHFICTKCKKIFEFYDESLESIQRRVSDRYGIPISHKMEIYGICNNCKGDRELLRPLNYVSRNNDVIVKEIAGCKGFRRRMNDLGFILNEPVRIINNTGFGPVILEVKNSRIALGKGEAEKILVKIL